MIEDNFMELIIWDTCTPAPRPKENFKQLGNYAKMEVQQNPIFLFEAVSNAVSGWEEHRQSVYSIMQLQKMPMLYHNKH